MKPGLAIAALAVAAAAGYAFWLNADRKPAPSEHWATIDAYCVDCHNAAEFAGGVAFDDLKPDNVPGDAAVWEKAVRKLEAGLMPPPGEPRPDEARLGGLLAFLEDSLDAAARADPDPGAPVLRRMNRTEYGNAIRDLLALPVDATLLLPADDSSQGFDNIADVLNVSPAHMQAYVSAAAKISRLAVGDPTASPTISTYTPERGLSQAEHLEGFPLGTRGGLAAEHVFPLDAQYEITVRRAGSGFGLRGVGTDEPVEVTLDGERVSLLSGRAEPFRLSVPAGPHTIAVAIVRESRPHGVDDLFAELAPSPGVSALSIMGPFDAAGPGETPSRSRIFICEPAAVDEETPCAREILTALARRAFRRPARDLEASLDTLMSFYATGRALGTFETGIQHALARVLVDPQFIFRFEREADGLAAGAAYEIDDFELATRLSFFLWSSIPDDALLALAEAGRLRDPTVLEAEVGRMLADPRARSLVDSFASQWLGLRNLAALSPADREFDANLRQAFEQETKLLFASILEEDRSVVDLLTADYTFVDERLARHYGIPNVRGSRFRRVELGDDNRRGLLGHGSILMATSSPTRTSPVVRGAWILDNILGTPPPQPPPGVERNLDGPVAATAEARTVRGRLERHREDPSCAACHDIIDPLGFALENFDLVGRWRETDSGEAIDASGQLWDGTPVVGPAGLRAALEDRSDLFVQAFTERLLTYALGRGLEYYDMPTVRTIVAGAGEEDFRFAALVSGIVESVPFRMRRVERQPGTSRRR